MSAPRSKLSVATIQAVVADEFAIERQAMLKPTRRWGNGRPRHVAMFLSREMTQYSFRRLARAFGGCDHSTVQSGCREVREAMAGDAALRERIDTLTEALKMPDFGRAVA